METLYTHFIVYTKNKNNSSTFQNFQFLQSKLNSLIEKSKHKYYARLLYKNY